ncbi:galactokinase family protein [Adlercreutzia equolifaciens]|uniref:galactokinase n=1 Tax=Adlercreutzia equolifaciens TaxID=446660 RepID=UPI0023B1DD40|nr:galactokinase family protein [Adlercreutzia equolifaciens]MDE8702288.1 galactokinase family protein [Adlercreutzia equolifaciens]
MATTSPAECQAREKLALLRRQFDEAFASERKQDLEASFVLASAPGRMEIAGNHVDHQGGRVISGAIDERTWGLAAENGLPRIRVVMDGFGTDVIELDDPTWLEPHPVERESSAALVRGMVASYVRAGGTVRGFDAVTTSDVPPGCGLSSSAAFEVMMGALVEGLFGGPASEESASRNGAAENPSVPVELAQAGTPVPLDAVNVALAAVQVEQRYFGKPCGPQDQLASACGGVVTIDFAPEIPQVEALELDTAAYGYATVLIDSRHDHSLHQDEFSAIPADMRMVANMLGVTRLGDTTAEALLDQLAAVRSALGDRRTMRALHYFDEVERVNAQRAALEAGDFSLFLKNVRLSGASSAQFLQNVSLRDPGSETRQPAMVIQSLCAHLLEEKGAWRIHGGGFGGSVLAFVPLGEVDDFVAAMNRLLGYEACQVVAVGGAGVWAVRGL